MFNPQPLHGQLFNILKILCCVLSSISHEMTQTQNNYNPSFFFIVIQLKGLGTLAQTRRWKLAYARRQLTQAKSDRNLPVYGDTISGR